jgi:glycosyltransferase involved in cell wall biosynthesis
VAGGPATILYLHSSSGRYGADRQLQLIASGLDRRRYRPLVVLPEAGPLVDDLRAADVEVAVQDVAVLRREHLTPAGVAGLVAGAARDGARLARLIRRRGVALVHSNTSVVLGGAPAAELTRRPHVWHVREIYSRWPRFWPGHRRLLGTAAALPCVSAATAAQFEGNRSVRVIADGLVGDPGRADAAEARRRLALPADAPMLAMLGRISDWKGQDLLVRALAEPPLRDRDAVGLIAGEAWPGAERHTAQLIALARKLAVSDRLQLLGFRSDLNTVLGAADVIAVPSTAPDPLPGAAIEAAAAGCAVIAADHGGLPEILRDGVSGRLVPPGDPAALATAAAELIDDPAMRARLGETAARDVRERFAPRRLLESVQRLYDELLEPSA